MITGKAYKIEMWIKFLVLKHIEESYCHECHVRYKGFNSAHVVDKFQMSKWLLERKEFHERYYNSLISFSN